MGKYYLRYLVFWLPAVIIAFICKNPVTLPVYRSLAALLPVSETAAEIFPESSQWFFAFFMLFGWGVTTATAAYRFPRRALSFVLFYTGVNLLVIMGLYAMPYGSGTYFFLRDYGGILSYLPLGVIVNALRDFNIYQEVFVTLLAAGSCLVGYGAALLRRHVQPNPYRPRIG